MLAKMHPASGAAFHDNEAIHALAITCCSSVLLLWHPQPCSHTPHFRQSQVLPDGVRPPGFREPSIMRCFRLRANYIGETCNVGTEGAYGQDKRDTSSLAF